MCKITNNNYIYRVKINNKRPMHPIYIQESPSSILERIIGDGFDKKFGKPFLDAFKSCGSNIDIEELEIAAYTCSLYLSSAFAGLPTKALHTFIHHTRESHSRFSFDCRMYETLYAHINESTFTLITDGNGSIERKCSKQEIFEAFDFYTNQ